MTRKATKSRTTRDTYHVTDNEWLPVVAEESWECCGCGLVHTIRHRMTDTGQIEQSWTVDEKATKAARVNRVKTEPVR